MGVSDLIKQRKFFNLHMKLCFNSDATPTANFNLTSSRRSFPPQLLITSNVQRATGGSVGESGFRVYLLCELKTQLCEADQQCAWLAKLKHTAATSIKFKVCAFTLSFEFKVRTSSGVSVICALSADHQGKFSG